MFIKILWQKKALKTGTSRTSVKTLSPYFTVFNYVVQLFMLTIEKVAWYYEALTLIDVVFRHHVYHLNFNKNHLTL